MAKSQEDGITILLGLKDYNVGEVMVVVETAVKGRKKKCPYCSTGMVCASQGKCSTVGATAGEFILSLTATAGNATIVDIPLPRAGNWSGLVPDSPDKSRLRLYGSSGIETSAR